MSLRELEFTISCIENLAQKMKMKPRDIYDLLARKTDLLQTYIIPSYDVLHTQDKEYVADDILSALKSKGVAIA